MEQALSVAKVFYDSYYDCFHEYMDEMKMHKLMYLVQRESLMMNKDVFFRKVLWLEIWTGIKEHTGRIS